MPYTPSATGAAMALEDSVGSWGYAGLVLAVSFTKQGGKEPVLYTHLPGTHM